MGKYTSSVAGTALSTSTGLLTIQTTASGAGSVVVLSEILLGGEASSSSVARIAVNRPSAAPTGAATAQTAEKLHPAAPTPGATIATAYATTQGTLSTNDVLAWAFNAFGGFVRWVAMPTQEVVVGTQGAVAYLIIRSRSGTPTVSGHLIWEEP